MANETTVTVTTIKNIDKLVDTGAASAILALCESGTTQAKLLQANRVTGFLNNSIQYVTSDGKKGGRSEGNQLSVTLRKEQGAVGATAEYAVYQEFGTRYIAPRSFLRGSLLLTAGVTPETVKEKMDAEFALGPLKYGQERTKF